MNELFWLAMLLANFALILLAYRVFGKMGLYIWVPISVIIANIQVIQGISLFGFAAIRKVPEAFRKSAGPTENYYRLADRRRIV